MTNPTARPLTAALHETSPLLAIVGPLVAGVVFLAGWLIRRGQTRRGSRRPGSPAVKVAALAAVGCTAYSADTSWRFAADYLDMGGTAERAAMFAAAELALFATALMARQNLTTQGAPGLPGVLVWVITGVQVIPAYAESGPVGGTVRAFVGPVMAAMLWHQAMGIELRLHKPGAASSGILTILGREMRERLLSRLGIAGRNRDSAQITLDRATDRAVALAARLAERSPKRRENWRGRRIARRLSVAIARASVGSDPLQRQALLQQLAARRHATALATVDLPSPWTACAVDEEEEGGEAHADGHRTGPRTGTEPAATGDQYLVPDYPGDQDSAGDRPQEDGPRPATGTDEDETGDREEFGFGDRENTVPEPDGDIDGTGARTRETAAQGTTEPVPAVVADSEDQHAEADPGTAHNGDGPPSDSDDGHRDPAHTDAGTSHSGDRPRTVPAKRKPQPKAPRNRTRGGLAKQVRKQPPLTVDQMVEQVRPHVPALLERDGNEAITRVQLREILRAQGLQGGRNERLPPVLQRLRNEASTTTTRSKTP